MDGKRNLPGVRQSEMSSLVSGPTQFILSQYSATKPLYLAGSLFFCLSNFVVHMKQSLTFHTCVFCIPSGQWQEQMSKTDSAKFLILCNLGGHSNWRRPSRGAKWFGQRLCIVGSVMISLSRCRSAYCCKRLWALKKLFSYSKPRDVFGSKVGQINQVSWGGRPE